MLLRRVLASFTVCGNGGMARSPAFVGPKGDQSAPTCPPMAPTSGTTSLHESYLELNGRP
jgi:hypothetical protein